MVEDYQNAAGLMVMLVYAIVAIAVVSGVVMVVRSFLHKRSSSTDARDADERG